MSIPLNEIYDGFAETYESNRDAFDISNILNAFYSALDHSTGDLLDLGCGAGEPVARYFIDKTWHVTGVDFSQRMLELASKYTPEMRTIKNDIRDVEFEPETFDAITATYSLFHIPQENHAEVFNKIFEWLRPNGRILFTYATKDYTGSDTFSGYKKFIDTALYYSHKSQKELLFDLENSGYEIESQENHCICNETFLWVTAKKPIK